MKSREKRNIVDITKDEKDPWHKSLFIHYIYPNQTSFNYFLFYSTHFYSKNWNPQSSYDKAMYLWYVAFFWLAWYDEGKECLGGLGYEKGHFFKKFKEKVGCFE